MGDHVSGFEAEQEEAAARQPRDEAPKATCEHGACAASIWRWARACVLGGKHSNPVAIKPSAHDSVCAWVSRPHIAVTCNCTLSGTIPRRFHLHSTDWSIRDNLLSSTNKVEGDFPPLSVQLRSRRTTVCVHGLAARTLL